MQQHEYIGYNSINHLKEILSNNKPKRIFLVTGKKSYEKSGAKKLIDSYLSGYDVQRFFEFEVNPKLKDIENGIKLFRKNNCDFVIAIGGGSVMDVAKTINVLAANKGKPRDFINNKYFITINGKTLVAIPTTSGSGSEATKFSVIYVGKTKYTLDHEFILPDHSIVDFQFTMDLPKNITACTGMDALSQAIESYWSVNSTDESKKFSSEAIKLIMRNICQAVNNPLKESREAMAHAAFLAGKAINISRTTACHAVSYPITSYFNVVHGHAVALTLGQMMKYNSYVDEDELLDKRGIDYVKQVISEILEMLNAKNVEEGHKKISDLMKDIGLVTRLSEVGIKSDDDVEIIIKNGFNAERIQNNPRRLTEEKLREILREIS